MALLVALIIIHFYIFCICWISWKYLKSSSPSKVLKFALGIIAFANCVIPAYLFNMVFLRSMFGFICAWIINFRMFGLARGYISVFKKIRNDQFRLFCFALALPMRISVEPKGNENSSFKLAGMIIFKIFMVIIALILDYLCEASGELIYVDLMVFLGYPWILYWIAGALFDLASLLSVLILNIKVDSNFDNPYLAITFGEFWGRRWNMVVSNLLKETIYIPVLKLSGANRFLAVISSFFASACMHELMFYYLTGSFPFVWFKFFFVNGIFCIIESIVRPILLRNFKWGAFFWRVNTTLVLLYVSKMLFFSPLHVSGTSSEIRKFLIGF